MSWAMDSSSPEHPDTIQNWSPVPPTTALQEFTDIFMYGEKNQKITVSVILPPLIIRA